MSYRFAISTPKTELRDDIEQASAGTSPKDSEVRDHVNAALAALDAIVPVVGREDDRIFVEVEGHANPGHGPRQHYPDESLTIRVGVIGAAPDQPTIHDPSNQRPVKPRPKDA